MSRSPIPVVIVLLVLSLSECVFSQVPVSGVVVDTDARPIRNVQVAMVGTGIGDVTSITGRYLFTDIDSGKYTVRFQHIGYETRWIDFRVGITEVALDTVVLKSLSLMQETWVVTATRTRQKTYDVPQSLNIVSQQEVVERSAKSTAETLREETGVFVQKTNHGGGSPIIRGLSSNQILLLVDGIRLNNSTYRLGSHQYLTTVDQFLIEHLEVVRGPTSALYGSDALGGTINILTRAPSFLKEPGTKTGYRAYGRYGSADDEKIGHLDLTVRSKNITFTGGFSVKDFGDLTRGKNGDNVQLRNSTNGLKQSPSGFKAYDADARLSFRPVSSQQFVLAYQHTRQFDVPRYDKYEAATHQTWIFEPQVRDLFYLNHEFRPAGGFLSRLRSTVSLHIQEEGRKIQSVESSVLTRESDKVSTLGFNIQGERNAGNHLFSIGGDFYLDFVDSERSFLGSGETVTSDSRGRYPDDATYQSFGIFVQDEATLSPDWKLIGGFRFSYFFTEFRLPAVSTGGVDLGKINQDFTAITGSAGAIYRLTERLQFNANIGQAFRAPNLSDLTKLGESKGQTYDVPNLSLGPEKAVSVDAGVRFFGEKLEASGAVYMTQIFDVLESVDTTFNGSSTISIGTDLFDVRTKENAGEAFIYGFELGLRYRPGGHLFFHGNLTYTHGENTTRDEPLGGIPPLFGTAGLRWQRRHFFAQLTTRFALSQDRLSTDDLADPRFPEGGTPGWQIFSAKSGYELWNSTSILCAVENIGDLNYREHGSGINGPGRNFLVALEFKR